VGGPQREAAPDQQRCHRLQHLSAWSIHGLVALRQHLLEVATGRIARLLEAVAPQGRRAAVAAHARWLRRTGRPGGELERRRRSRAALWSGLALGGLAAAVIVVHGGQGEADAQRGAAVTAATEVVVPALRGPPQGIAQDRLCEVGLSSVAEAVGPRAGWMRGPSFARGRRRGRERARGGSCGCLRPDGPTGATSAIAADPARRNRRGGAASCPKAASELKPTRGLEPGPPHYDGLQGRNADHGQA
jgi:hypothetical protein